MSYAEYKFHKAIRSLGVSLGQKRVWLASNYVVRIVMLDAETVPKQIREEFRRFQADMTSNRAPGVALSVRATVKEMSQAQVIKMILRIIGLRDSIRYYEYGINRVYTHSANLDSHSQAA